MLGVHPLLERYNPLLAIFPHDAAQSRPGSIALEAGKRTWGDYHPCSADFFATLAHLETEPAAFDYASLLPWGRGSWKPLPVTPLAEMAERVRRASPDTTRGWALDLAAIPSQSEGEAWRVYGRVLAAASEAFEEVAYGRVREYADGRMALQYWYLYVYNDFGNKHEGDWEMAVIELDAQERPVRMAVSAHMGGTQRRWRDVEKVGERPIVFVGRGIARGLLRVPARRLRRLGLGPHAGAAAAGGAGVPEAAGAGGGARAVAACGAAAPVRQHLARPRAGGAADARRARERRDRGFRVADAAGDAKRGGPRRRRAMVALLRRVVGLEPRAAERPHRAGQPVGAAGAVGRSASLGRGMHDIVPELLRRLLRRAARRGAIR